MCCMFMRDADLVLLLLASRNSDVLEHQRALAKDIGETWTHEMTCVRRAHVRC